MGGKILRGKLLGLPLSTLLGTWRKPTPIGKTLSLLSKAATSRIGDGKGSEKTSR